MKEMKVKMLLSETSVVIRNDLLFSVEMTFLRYFTAKSDRTAQEMRTCTIVSRNLLRPSRLCLLYTSTREGIFTDLCTHFNL